MRQARPTQAEQEWAALYSHMVRIKSETRRMKAQGYICDVGLLAILAIPISDLRKRIESTKDGLPFIATQAQIARFQELANRFAQSLGAAETIHRRVKEMLGNEPLSDFVACMRTLSFPPWYVLTKTERQFIQLFEDYQNALSTMESNGARLSDFLRKILMAARDNHTHNPPPYELEARLEQDLAEIKLQTERNGQTLAEIRTDTATIAATMPDKDQWAQLLAAIKTAKKPDNEVSRADAAKILDWLCGHDNRFANLTGQTVGNWVRQGFCPHAPEVVLTEADLATKTAFVTWVQGMCPKVTAPKGKQIAVGSTIERADSQIKPDWGQSGFRPNITPQVMRQILAL